MLFAPTPTPAATPKPATSFRDLGASWHDDLVDFIRHDAIKIVVILALAFVLQRVVAFFVHRMVRLADAYSAGNPSRAAQLRTMAAILRATCYGLIGFIALLQILPLFNIDLKPLLASAGVVGLGISFGAQSLFKDMLNGILILLEDQFNVGDVVKIAGLTGSVEDLSLRATQLRDGDGTLYFIPNSQIATVSNLSRQFSVASLAVSVDASADPDRVVALLKTLALEVRNDPAFASVALADPMVLGVDNIHGREVTYPIIIRVRANQKDDILRALRRKILLAFEKENIPLGTPTSTVVMQPQTQTNDPTVATPPPPSQALSSPPQHDMTHRSDAALPSTRSIERSERRPGSRSPEMKYLREADFSRPVSAVSENTVYVEWKRKENRQIGSVLLNTQSSGPW